MNLGFILGRIWNHFGRQNACKKQPSFFIKKGDEISSERDPKGTPRGPQNQGFREPFGPQPPKTPPEDGKWTQNSIVCENVPKMHPTCVPHFVKTTAKSVQNHLWNALFYCSNLQINFVKCSDQWTSLTKQRIGKDGGFSPHRVKNYLWNAWLYYSKLQI